MVPIESAAQEPERLEAHNAAIDEQLAGAGSCARIHLASGRVCLKGHDHTGSCDFVVLDRTTGSS